MKRHGDAKRIAVRPFPERPAIGWIGSAGNLHYLTAIAPALERIVSRFPETEIAVCCDRPPELPGLPVRYVPWSEEAEADNIIELYGKQILPRIRRQWG